MNTEDRCTIRDYSYNHHSRRTDGLLDPFHHGRGLTLPVRPHGKRHLSARPARIPASASSPSGVPTAAVLSLAALVSTPITVHPHVSDFGSLLDALRFGAMHFDDDNLEFHDVRFVG